MFERPEVPSAHSHSHEHIPSRSVPTSPTVRLVALGLLILAAAATVLGLLKLWPDYGAVAQVAGRTEFAVPGTTFEQAEVMSIGECAATGQPDPSGTASAAQPGACQNLSVKLLSGKDAGHLIEVPVHGALAASGLQLGDRIEVMGYPSVVPVDGTDPADGGTGYEVAQSYDASGVYRHLPLLVLTVVFALVVIGVGRLRGLLALIALGISAGVLLGFVLPALVAGGPGLLIGLVGASAIMFVILYLVHGPNMRTTAALIGTLSGIGITALISLISVQVTTLSGLGGDEASGVLSTLSGDIDFRGLLSCSIIIAGLGILNDVTITQASSVWELRAAAPGMPRREVYRRAMRIGRDHIASTVYTVFFAYVGAALSVLILLYLYDRPVLSLLTHEDIAIEIVRTLCGSIGLVLAVPITTWVASLAVREVAPAQ